MVLDQKVKQLRASGHRGPAGGEVKGERRGSIERPCTRSKTSLGFLIVVRTEATLRGAYLSLFAFHFLVRRGGLLGSDRLAADLLCPRPDCFRVRYLL